MSGEKQYLTIEEVAEVVRAPVETMRHWRKVGEGPRSFKLGRRVLYAVEDVESWVAERRGEPATKIVAPSPAAAPSAGACLDCGRRYGDEYGFPDLMIPDDA